MANEFEELIQKAYDRGEDLGSFEIGDLSPMGAHKTWCDGGILGLTEVRELARQKGTALNQLVEWLIEKRSDEYQRDTLEKMYKGSK
ncbi:MAG: hypothetical protein WCL07_01410 [bacterium]